MSIKLDFRGYVNYDEHVIKAMKMIRPLVIEYPKCKASICIYDLAIGLMGYEGARIRYAEGKLKKELKQLRRVW